MMPSSIQSMLWLRVKILLQAMDHRQHRRTKLFVGQVTLLLAASVVYYQRTFFTTNQPESSISIVNTNSSVSTVSTSDKVFRPPKHWILTAQQKGKVDCQISTTPVVSSPSLPLPTTEQFTIDNDKEQYVLHIHGLHHSGTGYLRQTLYDALNQAFSHKSEYRNGTIASMQDSLRPYQQLIDEAGTDKKKINQLHKRYYKPEDEGQHLQTIYPSFAVRYSKVKNVKGSDKFNRLSYIADICNVVNNEDTSDNVSALDSSGDGLPDVDNYKLLGNALFQQWSQYWDTSATFLLQKSPMLDLLFLEKTKILPTLHVIVVRHPMTSNSWGTSNMSYLWLHSWIHSFQALANQKIEWYAVVTYEALISYHDQVVEELLEVVRSGMDRYQNRDGRSSLEMAGIAATNDDEEENAERRRSTSRNGDNNTSRTRSTTTTNHHRRRLEMHGNKSTTQSSSNSYLIPKERSMKLWKKCLDRTICADILSRLTKDIFPDLGYVNEDDGRPLRKTPGTVTVSKEYGRVLFTSEGLALNKLRQEITSSSSSSTRDGTLNDEAAEQQQQPQQQLIDYVPTFELISKMERALK